MSLNIAFECMVKTRSLIFAGEITREMSMPLPRIHTKFITHDCLHHDMKSLLNRRNLIGIVFSAAIGGCVSNFNGDSGEKRDGCHLEPGRWEGKADPMDVSVTIEGDEDIDVQLARAAVDAAFEALDERFDIDLSTAHWIKTVVKYDGETATPFIRAVYTINKDGEILQCPDSSFEVHTARKRLPAAITVSGIAEQNEYERSYSMHLKTGPEKLD